MARHVVITSAGDDIDLALRNAPEALELYAEGFQ